MNIDAIYLSNEGYVYCKSAFYSSADGLSMDTIYKFSPGINKLFGEIDSGIWAASYILSMHKRNSDDFILFMPPCVKVNDFNMPLENFTNISCYLDKSYPLFSNKIPVDKQILKGIKTNHLDVTVEEIRELFGIDEERIKRPLSGVGNEIFKAMCAIGYVNNKQVFCFPWMSQRRFESYHNHLTWVLDILDKLHMVVILPLGKDTGDGSEDKDTGDGSVCK